MSDREAAAALGALFVALGVFGGAWLVADVIRNGQANPSRRRFTGCLAFLACVFAVLFGLWLALPALFSDG